MAVIFIGEIDDEASNLGVPKLPARPTLFQDKMEDPQKQRVWGIPNHHQPPLCSNWFLRILVIPLMFGFTSKSDDSPRHCLVMWGSNPHQRWLTCDRGQHGTATGISKLLLTITTEFLRQLFFFHGDQVPFTTLR